MSKIKDEMEELFEELLNEDFENEVLQEVTITTASGSLTIGVESDRFTDRGWSKDPYFKVFKDGRSKVARIYVDRPEYCKEHKGIPVFELSKGDKRSLIEALSKDNYKNWKKLLKEVSKQTISKGYGPYPEDLSMPDYMKL